MAEYDEVDNGVGLQQCGSAGCLNCHAIEMVFDEDDSCATEEERRYRWWKGSA